MNYNGGMDEIKSKKTERPLLPLFDDHHLPHFANAIKYCIENNTEGLRDLIIDEIEASLSIMLFQMFGNGKGDKEGFMED